MNRGRGVPGRWPLIVILLLAAAVRLWGIWYLLPFVHTPDEQYVVNNALWLNQGVLPDTLGWPATTLIFVVSFTYDISYVVGHLLGMFQSTTDFALAYIQDPTYWYMVPRIYSALSGITTVCLVYLLGKRMFNWRAGLLGALFLAVSPLHSSLSQTGLADAPMTMMVVLSLLLCHRVLAKGDTAGYVMAGLTAGLATATKFNAGPLIFAIIASHVLAKRGWRFFRLLRSREIWMACGFFVVGLYIGFPYLLTALRPAVGSIISTPIGQASGGRALGAETLDLGWWYLSTQLLPQAMGTPVAVLSGAGIVYGLWRRRWGTLLLLSFLLPYFLLLGASRALYDRYALPLVPLLALFAGLALDALVQRVEANSLSRHLMRSLPAGAAVAIFVVAGGVSLPSFYPDLVSAYSRSESDTRIDARQWVHENIPAGSVVATDDYGPYLLPTIDSLQREDRWWQDGFDRTRAVILKAEQKNLPRLANMLKEDPPYNIVYIGINSDTPQEDIDRYRPEWVIISSGTYSRYMDEVAMVRYPQQTSMRREFYKRLESTFSLVKVFDPSNTDQSGPVIKIYRRTQ